jgi:hypothetical protein
VVLAFLSWKRWSLVKLLWVIVLNIKPNLPDLIDQVRNAIIIKHGLMHFLKDNALVFMQRFAFFFWNNLLESFGDLTLNPERYVLFYKVFHHCKMIGVIFQVHLEVLLSPLKLGYFGIKINSANLFSLDAFDIFLDLQNVLGTFFDQLVTNAGVGTQLSELIPDAPLLALEVDNLHTNFVVKVKNLLLKLIMLGK